MQILLFLIARLRAISLIDVVYLDFIYYLGVIHISLLKRALILFYERFLNLF